MYVMDLLTSVLCIFNGVLDVNKIYKDLSEYFFNHGVLDVNKIYKDLSEYFFNQTILGMIFVQGYILPLGLCTRAVYWWIFWNSTSVIDNVILNICIFYKAWHYW